MMTQAAQRVLEGGKTRLENRLLLRQDSALHTQAVNSTAESVLFATGFEVTAQQPAKPRKRDSTNMDPWQQSVENRLSSIDNQLGQLRESIDKLRSSVDHKLIALLCLTLAGFGGGVYLLVEIHQRLGEILAAL